MSTDIRPPKSTHIPRGAQALRADDAPAGERTSPREMKGAAAPLGWVDERTGASKVMNVLLKKVFPDHWSFMLGEIAMYSLVILILTGVFLTLWFVPSAGETTYQGSYVPLQGVEMSEAYRSTLDISFEIKGGLIIRQIHHWAALLFVVSIMLHMARVFFTGAFRKPREINWVIGTVLSMLALIEGFAGYSLPDDLLSGTGLRAAEGFVRSVPVIGSFVAFFMFGGEFPGESIIPRLYIVHVLLIPGILIGLFTAHILLVMVHKHTQYPGPGRTEKNVVGYPLMPVYIAKAGGFFFIVFGLTTLIAALVTINPVWVYGPYNPTQVTAGSQPDWYMGFADGALRLLPGWLEFTVLDTTWSFNVMIGAVLLIPVMYTAIGAYPFIEAWVTGDKREHHVLDRPRNAPTRTAIGVACIVFYVVLWAAAGNDLMALKLHWSINDITNVFRALVFIGPVVAFFVTKRICLSLQRRDRDMVLHGRETGRIVQTEEGEFFEVHEHEVDYATWKRVSYESPSPAQLEATAPSTGALGGLRRALRRFYFEDRVEPVTPAERREAMLHGHGPHGESDRELEDQAEQHALERGRDNRHN